MENVVAHQFDFVCNGYEMASGAVRNHNIEIMKKKAIIMVADGLPKVFKDKRMIQKQLLWSPQPGAPPQALSKGRESVLAVG